MSDTFANSVATTDRVLAAQIRQVFNDQITADIDPVDIGAVPTSRTINGQDLSANRTLTAANVGAVASNVTGITGATAISNAVFISQASYNSLSPKDANTLYVIV